MKKAGNRSKFTDAQQLQTVIEYLTNDASAREMAETLGVGEASIRLWTRKWRTIAEQSIANMEPSLLAAGNFDAEPDDEESPF